MTLSIVVIEYKSLNEIWGFVKQAQPLLSGIDFEIIVSSNSLYDVSNKAEIEARCPNVRWVFNRRNGGFAYGMNRGLEVAKGDLLMIANPDILLKRGMVEAVDFLNTHDVVGALGPVIKDEKGCVQDSARSYVTLNGWMLRQLKRVIGKNEKCDCSCVRTVDWVIGACILMKKEVYSKVQGLDERYFMYAEDLDLCARIRRAGYEVVYYPPMEIEYKGTRSARRSWKYAKIFMKSHWLFWREWGFFKVRPPRRDMFFD